MRPMVPSILDAPCKNCVHPTPAAPARTPFRPGFFHPGLAISMSLRVATSGLAKGRLVANFIGGCPDSATRHI